MADNDLIRRIESLNRRPLKHQPGDETEVSGFPERMRGSSASRKATGRSSNRETPVGVSGLERSGSPETNAAYEREVSGFPERLRGPSATREARGRSSNPETPLCRLEEAVVGVVTEPRPGCCCYHIECHADDPEVCAEVIHSRFVQLTGHPDTSPIAPLADIIAGERLDPTRAVFMDIETTGLRGTPLFLIGVMRSDGERFIYKQYFARDYAEEPGVIAAFRQDLRDAELLVTFNGIRFDLPFIVGRGAHHGIRVRCEAAHLDLLQVARRRYRRETPNCKLQTLERMICGREREEDIPSSQIPQAYDDYVFTGDASKITSILRHNRLDLLTLPELMCRMWRDD